MPWSYDFLGAQPKVVEKLGALEPDSGLTQHEVEQFFNIKTLLLSFLELLGGETGVKVVASGYAEANAPTYKHTETNEIIDQGAWAQLTEEEKAIYTEIPGQFLRSNSNYQIDRVQLDL